MKDAVTKLLFPLCIVFVCFVGAPGQGSNGSDDDPVGISEIYLAKDDGSGAAGEETSSFLTTDVPIYCVVQLDSAVPTIVRMNLVAVAVPGVKAETNVVSTSYTTKDNQSRVNFSGRPAGRWVVGRYRVDIFVGSAQAVSREFVVVKSATTKVPPKPNGDKSRLAGPVTKRPTQ